MAEPASGLTGGVARPALAIAARLRQGNIRLIVGRMLKA